MNNHNRNIQSFLIFFILLGYCMPSFAVGLGGVAQNMLEPVDLFNDLIDTACFVIGGAFLFATIIKYVEHRRSPLMVPISTVIFLFIAGVILVALPFLSFAVNTGVEYSLFK